MKRGKRIFRIGGLIVAALLVLIIAFSLYIYFHKSTLKNYLERALSKKAGLTVEIGRLNYRLFPLRMEADSIKVLFVGGIGRVDVRIDRAEAGGNLTRLMKKQKPIFDSLAISGMKLEFSENLKPLRSGPLNLREMARGISGSLEEVGDLTVKDSSFHLRLPGEGMDLSATGVDLKAAGTDRTTIELIAARLDFLNDRPRGAFAAGFRGEVSWSRAGPFSLEGSIDLTDSSVSLPEKRWEETGFSVKAGFQADEKTVTVSAFSLDLPGLAALSGSGRAEWGETAAATISAKLNIKNIESARKTFAPFLPPDLPEFFLDGGAEAEGDVRLERRPGPMKISVNGTLRLPPAHFLMRRSGLSIDQMLQAELHLEGEPADLRVRGFIEGRQGRWAADAFQVSGFSFRLPVEVEENRVNLTSLEARAEELVISAGTRKLNLAGLSINGKARLDFLNKAVDVDSLAVAVPRLGDFTLAGNVNLKPQRKVHFTLLARNLEIGDIGGYFAAFIPETLTAWQPKGRVDLSLEIGNAEPDVRRYQVQGTANLSKFAFQDSAGSIVSEGLEPRLKFNADVLSFSQAIPFSLRGELSAGESLWKDVYLNWGNEPVQLEIKGTLEPRLEQIREAAGTVTFPPLGEVQLRGLMGFGPKPRFDFHLAAPSIDLASLNAFIGKVKLHRLSPWEIQGTAETETDIQYESVLSVRGKVKVHKATAVSKDGSLNLAGIEIDFPFSVSNRFRLSGEKENYFFAPGRILIQEIKTPFAVLDPLSIAFYSADNLFLFLPGEIGLWGSRFELGKTALSVSPLSLGIRGFSSLRLASLDLSRLPFNSAGFTLGGRTSIPAMKLEIRPGEFVFTGPLLADLFGGRLTLDDIRVTDVFSAGRRFFFRADIAGLDLKQLTDSVPFGEVTGIVDASVRNFVLSYGQPENFLLSIVSVPRKGVPRKFSLKAVDNLSIISSAGPAGIPSNNFFIKLLHSFNYSRIGISCSLKNDVFTLQGTIVEGGIQYLVRRAAFFGIDVINGNPVNQISFKDMLERLKRVGQNQERK
ncbi:MAG: hypothetical protein ACYDH3_01925 [Candidatus Aminicenantales bacterium]